MRKFNIVIRLLDGSRKAITVNATTPEAAEIEVKHRYFYSWKRTDEITEIK